MDATCSRLLALVLLGLWHLASGKSACASRQPAGYNMALSAPRIRHQLHMGRSALAACNSLRIRVH